MKKNLLLFVIAFMFVTGGYSQGFLWIKTSKERLETLPKMERATMPSQYELYTLNYEAMKQQLQNAPLDSSLLQSTVVIAFPNSDGQLQNYRIYEAPVMEKGLSDKYTGIKSYSGQGIEDATASIRFSTTLFGLHVMSFSGNSGTFYIDTYTKNLSHYIVYNRKNIQQTENKFNCLVQDETTFVAPNHNAIQERLVTDGIFRQYRLAMACTIEYAAFHVAAAGLNSGTLEQKKAAVLSAMVVTMTRVNGLYERDMSMRMNLIANNDLIIFITSDNFNNTNATTLIGQSQTVIDATIGTENYDIGHTVSTGGGGLAGVGPCATTKARGITGSGAPVGDPYDIDYVAHEMGHQFGASHTFNNDCGGNRSSSTAVEPGSGTTIMAYAGICAPDIQGNSDAHFHAVSIAQMTSYVLNFGTCSDNTSNGNIAPVVNAGVNRTIPKGTAFILKGTATDANNDALTYCWEQTNTQISVQPPLSTATTGPNFKSRPPSTSPNRYMPAFAEVLAGNLTPTWEVVPNVARTMSFALTVRDNRSPNGGQTNRDNMSVIFANVGPFQITSPSAANVSWDQGSTQTITWDVAGTTANNINTANVNILLSTDGGTTFSTVLASNTLNDGSEEITLPFVASTSCRIMIEAVNNIFYAVSKNLYIGYSCNVLTDGTTTAIADGIGANSPGAITTKTLSFPTNVTIDNMKVSFVSNHSWLGDLVVKLKHPDGTEITLWNRTCNNPQSSGLNILFSDAAPAPVCLSPTSGTYRPVQLLSAFNGKPSEGVWTLTAQDFYIGDSGSINSWGLDFGCTLGTSTAELSDFTIYPNPSKGDFNIQFTNSNNEEVTITIFDIRGRKVYENSYDNQPLVNENIQLNNVEKGIYLVTLSSGNTKQVKKIIIE